MKQSVHVCVQGNWGLEGVCRHLPNSLPNVGALSAFVSSHQNLFLPAQLVSMTRKTGIK